MEEVSEEKKIVDQAKQESGQDTAGQSTSTVSINAPNSPPTDTPRMANTLANLRSCVKEFNPEETGDLSNQAKRFVSWLENFEACADFEEVTAAKRKPAVLALGGEQFRELCKSLGINAQDTFDTMKTKLTTHFTPKKILLQNALSFST